MSSFFLIPICATYCTPSNVQTEHPTTWQAFNRRIHAVYDFDKNKKLNLKEKRIQTKLADLPPIDYDDDLPF